MSAEKSTKTAGEFSSGLKPPEAQTFTIISSTSEPLVIRYKTSKSNNSDAKHQVFYCPSSNCRRKFPALVFLKVHYRKHRKVKAYRCLYKNDDNNGEACTHSASVKGNMMTHVHKIHTRDKRPKFDCHYLMQFIEEDKELLKKEEVFFADAQLKLISDGKKKKVEEDSIENSKEKEKKGDLKELSYESVLARYRQAKLLYPFRCRMGCQWRFAAALDRRYHERDHLDITPYQCLWPIEEENGNTTLEDDDSFHVCGQRFHRLEFVRDHLRDVHEGEVCVDDVSILDQFIQVEEDMLSA